MSKWYFQIGSMVHECKTCDMLEWIGIPQSQWVDTIKKGLTKGKQEHKTVF